MELKIGVQELARALARSQGIVEKKSTMFRCVLWRRST